MPFYIRSKERAAMSEKSGTKKRNPLKLRDSFPFAAFAIAVIAEKLWSYFEDNRY